ncbi:MAG: MFS transporter, partial [Caldilinea sp.]|nr:MFS transporter [Caldilinea sp.]
GLGALLFVAGRHPAVTIAGTLVMGGVGTLLLVMIQATLSDRHGAQRATAITESNMLAILCAGLLPLLVGLFEGTPLGWRGAIYAGLAAGIVLALTNWRTPIPPRRPRTVQQGSGRLPAVFWAYWSVLLLSVSMEWSLIGWSADFLNTVVGLSVTNAAMLVSVFFFGAVLGRFANSRWTRFVSPRKLLLAMLLVVAIGFPLLWLARLPAINVLGLGIAGFGVGSLFPLGLSLALAVAADEVDAASGYTSLGTGLAMLV